MTVRLPLEDFLVDIAEVGPLLPSFGAPAPEPLVSPEVEAEPSISQAYDLGYQTGWAARDMALAESQGTLIADLREVLHGLTFTLEEARQHMTLAVAPAFEALVAKVLPELAAKTWGQHVVAELMQVAEQAAEAPITLALSPQAIDALEDQLAAAVTPPFRLVPDPNLTPLQAAFRFGNSETLLDMEGLLQRIRQQVEAVLAEAPKEFAHG